MPFAAASGDSRQLAQQSVFLAAMNIDRPLEDQLPERQSGKTPAIVKFTIPRRERNTALRDLSSGESLVSDIVWILLLNPWKISFDIENLLWFVTLMSTIGVVVFSLLVPAWFLDPKRTHNLEKLWNEILGKHQVAYVGFYLTLGGQRWFDLKTWEPQAFLLVLLLSLVLWLAGLVLVQPELENGRWPLVEDSALRAGIFMALGSIDSTMGSAGEVGVSSRRRSPSR